MRIDAASALKAATWEDIEGIAALKNNAKDKIAKTYHQTNKQDTAAHNHKEKGTSQRSHIEYIHDTMKFRWAVHKVTSKCIPKDFDFVEIVT